MASPGQALLPRTGLEFSLAGLVLTRRREREGCDRAPSEELTVFAWVCMRERVNDYDITRTGRTLPGPIRIRRGHNHRNGRPRNEPLKIVIGTQTERYDGLNDRSVGNTAGVFRTRRKLVLQLQLYQRPDRIGGCGRQVADFLLFFGSRVLGSRGRRGHRGQDACDRQNR